MTDRVGRQLVHSQDHIPGPALGQPGPADLGPHLGSQDVQRARVEGQVKDRRDAACNPAERRPGLTWLAAGPAGSPRGLS